MAIQAGITAFQANAFQFDAWQIAEDALGDGADYGGAHDAFKKRREKRRKLTARQLDRAIAKALDPERYVLRDQDPWLFEPVEPPVAFDIPVYSPGIAALQDQVTALEHQIAEREARALNEEADIDLLLMSF